jgi:hypothetical protein
MSVRVGQHDLELGLRPVRDGRLRAVPYSGQFFANCSCDGKLFVRLATEVAFPMGLPKRAQTREPMDLRKMLVSSAGRQLGQLRHDLFGSLGEIGITLPF